MNNPSFGTVGASIAAKAAPDGYTYVFGTAGTHGINAALYKKISFDVEADFTPITPVVDVPNVLTALMRDIAMPNGIGAVGYTKDDVDALVEGTMKQQRLLATAPREVTEEDAAAILRASLELW